MDTEPRKVDGIIHHRMARHFDELDHPCYVPGRVLACAVDLAYVYSWDRHHWFMFCAFGVHMFFARGGAVISFNLIGL